LHEIATPSDDAQSESLKLQQNVTFLSLLRDAELKGEGILEHVMQTHEEEET